MEHTGFVFVPPHNTCDYLTTMGNSQEEALVTSQLRQNQALFRKYTTVGRALNKQIITAMELVFLYPLVEQMTGFGHVSALTMIQHLFSSYGMIDKINLKTKSTKMMGPYDPAEPFPRIDITIGKGERISASRRTDDC